jgi:acyl-CoA thioesterase-2
MSDVLADLVSQLSLEPLEENLFRGQSQDLGWGTVFGGQVLGQALSAAAQTVEADRQAHSLHAYFLLPGDVSRPIIYHVERLRDGGSFSTRRIVATQHGRPIFSMIASFQKPEEGFSHQASMPEVPVPEEVPTEQARYAEFAKRYPSPRWRLGMIERPFWVHPITAIDDPFRPTPQPPTRMLWMRANGSLPDKLALHQYLLAYISDHSLLGACLMPHGVTWHSSGMQVASLDHALWFHRPFRVDEWLLYVMESPSASGGRGFSRGSIFTQDGVLVASTTQEGLVRRREKG